MMKQLILLLITCWMLLTPAVTAEGIYIRGMKTGETIYTEYNDTTKQHTLHVVTSIAELYEDKILLFKFLHLESDSTIVTAIGNYSDAGLGKTAFIIKPKPGEIMMIAKMIISVEDDGTFDSGEYGNGIELTNGITTYFRQNGVDIIPGLDPNLPITKNTDWATMDYDTRIDSYGSGEAQLSARFSFTETGKYLRLNGDTGDEYVIYFHDDLSGLIAQHFLMQGYYEVGPI